MFGWFHSVQLCVSFQRVFALATNTRLHHCVAPIDRSRERVVRFDLCLIARVDARCSRCCSRSLVDAQAPCAPTACTARGATCPAPRVRRACMPRRSAILRACHALLVRRPFFHSIYESRSSMPPCEFVGVIWQAMLCPFSFHFSVHVFPCLFTSAFCSVSMSSANFCAGTYQSLTGASGAITPISAGLTSNVFPSICGM